MKKINKIIILLVISILVTTGCEEQEKTSTTNNNKVVSNGETVNTDTMKHKVCTRDADAGTGTEMVLQYDVYYTGEILNLLISHEELITENKDTLDEFEDAYKKIATNYAGLEYYEQNVTRTDNSVTNETTINYDKIDIQKLLDIEGEEDNIIENGKAKVDLYLDLLEKFGGTCEDVE